MDGGRPAEFLGPLHHVQPAVLCAGRRLAGADAGRCAAGVSVGVPLCRRLPVHPHEGAGESGPALGRGEDPCRAPRCGAAAGAEAQRRAAAEQAEHLQLPAQRTAGGLPPRAQRPDQRVGAWTGQGPCCAGEGVPRQALRQLPGEHQPRGGCRAGAGRGGPRPCGHRLYHQFPDAHRLSEGGGPAPQDPLPQLLPQRAPSAGAHLLPPHLRGDVSAGDAGGHRFPQRPGGLCGREPGVRRTGGHQRLCTGRAGCPAREPGGAAVGLPVG